MAQDILNKKVSTTGTSIADIFTLKQSMYDNFISRHNFTNGKVKSGSINYNLLICHLFFMIFISSNPLLF